MRAYRAAFAAILMSLIVGGAPALAQDTSRSVAFDGVGLVFERVLGTSVDITQVPGQPTDLQQPSGPEVPHLLFTLYGSQPETTKVPKASSAPGAVRFYRTADFAGYDQASRELEALSRLLGERPELVGSVEFTAGGTGGTLPYLPVMPAAQVIRAKAHYIDTAELAGVAYITAFRQDVEPFAADDFWYTFQGLSADGAWYVAADFVVDASLFPEKVRAKDAERISDPESYASYLSQGVASLEEATPDAFTPPLASIDALVESITFEDVPTMG